MRFIESLMFSKPVPSEKYSSPIPIPSSNRIRAEDCESKGKSQHQDSHDQKWIEGSLRRSHQLPASSKSLLNATHNLIGFLLARWGSLHVDGRYRLQALFQLNG